MKKFQILLHPITQRETGATKSVVHWSKTRDTASTCYRRNLFLHCRNLTNTCQFIFLNTIVGCMCYYMCIYVHRYISCCVSDFRINTVFTLWERWVLSTFIRKKRSIKNELKLFPFVFNSR